MFVSEEVEGEEGDYRFGLWQPDLALIGPNNDVIKGLGRRPAAKEVSEGPESQTEPSPGPAALPPAEGPKTRGAKRKGPATTAPDPAAVGPPLAGGPGGGKKAKGDAAVAKYAGFPNPVEHPFNRDGYRYYLAQQDPHAPNRSLSTRLLPSTQSRSHVPLFQDGV